MNKQPSDVFFVRLNDNEEAAAVEKKIVLLYQKAGFGSLIKPKDIVAIKTHFGEKGNVTYLKPKYIRQIVNEVKKNRGKPYLTETSVLYKGSRSNALDHINLAFQHGYTHKNVGAPIIMADGFLGVWEREITINGEFYEKVCIAGDAIAADKLLIISHVTGHMLTGIGATFKNMGMGLSSRKGKLNQHSEIAPSIKAAKCDYCKTCLKWCPENCIVEKEEKAFIIEEKCIGCGECLAVCRQEAVKFRWDATSHNLQKKMVEHAYGVFCEKKGSLAFMNFLVNMTKDCDCMKSKEKFIKDIGILASFDPVALDTATLDLTRKHNKDNLSKLAYPNVDPMIQIRHAEKLGMGTSGFRLVEI